MILNLQVIIENGVMFKDEPWHKTCFTCNECRIELAGTSFLVREEKAYCRECFGDKFSHKCTVCTKPIIGTSKCTFLFHNDISHLFKLLIYQLDLFFTLFSVFHRPTNNSFHQFWGVVLAHWMLCMRRLQDSSGRPRLHSRRSWHYLRRLCQD